MTLCPVALAVGCEKCPMFKFCPLTTVLGDQKKEQEENKKEEPKKRITAQRLKAKLDETNLRKV